MKKILSLILLSLSLTGWSAENLSELFSSELAQTKASENNVTMINSMELSGQPIYNDSHVRSRMLQSVLLSKEFKEFTKDKKVTVINIYRTLTYKDVQKLKKDAKENARAILGDNAPITEAHWRGTLSNGRADGVWKRMTKKEQDAHIKKLMARPLPAHYLQQAWKVLYGKEREKRMLLWSAFNGQAPVSLLLDEKGNVLNKKVFKRGLKVEDYINKYTEILAPEEAKEKAEKEKENKDDKEKEPENRRTFVDPVRPPKGK